MNAVINNLKRQLMKVDNAKLMGYPDADSNLLQKKKFLDYMCAITIKF